MSVQSLLLALLGYLMCSRASRATSLDLSSISGPAVVEQVIKLCHILVNSFARMSTLRGHASTLIRGF